MKTRFIANPFSGRAARALGSVREFAARHDASVVLTERPRHATELATQALRDGYELIVAVGGDGTLNEVGRALIDTPAVLGLVPCGSGNGLGRHLGIHGAISRALDVLCTGRPRLIDTGLADGHPFFTAAGLGLEAEVSARFNTLPGRGFLRYLIAGAPLVLRRRAEECLVQFDNSRERWPVITLAVANANQYGNGALIAPAARLDDGRLDLTILPALTVFNAPPLLTRLFTGTLDRAAGIVFRQGMRFVVERPAPGLIHRDGETQLAGQRVEFSVRPLSLRIMAPS